MVWRNVLKTGLIAGALALGAAAIPATPAAAAWGGAVGIHAGFGFRGGWAGWHGGYGFRPGWGYGYGWRGYPFYRAGYGYGYGVGYGYPAYYAAPVVAYVPPVYVRPYGVPVYYRHVYHHAAHVVCR